MHYGRLRYHTLLLVSFFVKSTLLNWLKFPGNVAVEQNIGAKSINLEKSVLGVYNLSYSGHWEFFFEVYKNCNKGSVIL